MAILEKRHEKPRNFLPVPFCSHLSWETRLPLSKIKRCFSPHGGSATGGGRESTKLSTHLLFLKGCINKQGYVNKKKNEVILLKPKNVPFLWGEQHNLRKHRGFSVPLGLV